MSIESSMAIQRSKSLLAQMPAWVDRRTVTNSQSGKTIHLKFHCPCGGPNKVSQSVYVGGEKDVAKLAAKLGEKVQEKHGLHNHASLSPPPDTQVQQLENEVRAQKRKATVAANALNQTTLKIKEAAAALKLHTENKRQKTLRDARKVGWDDSCKDVFSVANKSTAMVADGTGINACVEYWCEGSVPKVKQIVMALIQKHGLQKLVAAELDLERCETNDYIVGRARAAVQALKECRCEEERLQYRLILTALAPQDGDEMKGRTARALGLSKDGKPLADAIAKRAVIDDAIIKRNVPLAVGDDVVCRHGAGKLVRFTSLDQPCAVTITVGEYSNTSEFVTAGRGLGGGQVRRTPISFAHDPRAKRSDVTNAAVVRKVRPDTV